jgi:hypothetical protein
VWCSSIAWVIWDLVFRLLVKKIKKKKKKRKEKKEFFHLARIDLVLEHIDYI